MKKQDTEKTFLSEKIKEIKMDWAIHILFGFVIVSMVVLFSFLHITIDIPNRDFGSYILWLILLLNTLVSIVLYINLPEIDIEEAKVNESKYQEFVLKHKDRLRKNCVLYIKELHGSFDVYGKDYIHSYRLDLELYFPEIIGERDLYKAFYKECERKQRIKDNEEYEIRKESFKLKIKALPSSVKTHINIKVGLGTTILIVLNLIVLFALKLIFPSFLNVMNPFLLTVENSGDLVNWIAFLLNILVEFLIISEIYRRFKGSKEFLLEEAIEQHEKELSY